MCVCVYVHIHDDMLAALRKYLTPSSFFFCFFLFFFLVFFGLENNCWKRYGQQPNTDAFHTHGTNIYMSGLFVHNGDDGFPVEPAGYGEDTRNVLIENSHAECGSNGGVILIGSDRGGNNDSVRDVTFRNLTVVKTNQGAGIKISEPYEQVHGNATNITWTNITITAPRAASLYVNVFQEDAQQNEPYGCTMPNASMLTNDTAWMSANAITFADVTAGSLAECSTVCAPSTLAPSPPPTVPALAACFNCAPGTPCTLVTRNVSVPGETVCHNAVVPGLDCPQPSPLKSSHLQQI